MESICKLEKKNMKGFTEIQMKCTGPENDQECDVHGVDEEPNQEVSYSHPRY